MEGNGLFNPGFLGGSFYWFIGQVADDSTWRENQSPTKFEKVEDMPAWGYRYKVRIIGHHDQDESDVTAEQLPWAQVMYPVTAGNGIGGSFMTPALKQGMFVFGFFLDGKDEQTPIIMGCLGNNAKTKLERKMGTEGSGGKNFVPQSFHSVQQKISDFKVGDEFMVDGLAPNGELVKTKAKLISYNGMNKYVVESDGITVLTDGNEIAYPIIDDMVYESEIDEWVGINEYKY